MEKLNLELLSFELLQNEVWSFIPNIKTKYIVSTCGRIGTLIGGRYKLMSTSINRQGYPTACFSENGKRMTYRIHRLVGITFIPNPNNYPQINHIDENRSNNHVDNLEWCTAKHNLEHSGIIRKWSMAGTKASLEAKAAMSSYPLELKPKRDNYIKNKIRSYNRYYSCCKVYAYTVNHECIIYDNFKDAADSTGVFINFVILSCALNRKSKKLEFHSNGLFFSIDDIFWSWIIKKKIDVAQYFKEQQ